MNYPVVLVTGSTGVLGSAVLASLISQRLQIELLLLVRGKDLVEATARAKAAAARHGCDFLTQEEWEEGGSSLEAEWPRVRVIAGDLESPEFMQSQARVGLWQRITHVLHLAANTSFMSDGRLRQINVDGTLRLAKSLCEAPGHHSKLCRFLYVGTAAIAGSSPPPLVQEDSYPHEGTAHLVEYTRTKEEAELRLKSEFPGLPLVVARPSIVTGHSALGVGPSSSLFWLFRAVDRLHTVTWPRTHQLDVIPVDWTAEALIFLLLKPSLAFDRYHLSAGGASCDWDEIEAAFGATRRAGSGQSYREVSREVFRSLDLSGLAEKTSDQKRLRRALLLYFRFAELNVTYDNARLLSEGMRAPPSFASFVGVCEKTSQSIAGGIIAQMDIDS